MGNTWLLVFIIVFILFLILNFIDISERIFTGGSEKIILPPIREYKSSLMHSLINQLTMELNKKNNFSEEKIKTFKKIYNKYYAGWFFEINSKHMLDKNMIPKAFPINKYDEIWILNKLGLPDYEFKYNPDFVKNIKIKSDFKISVYYPENEQKLNIPTTFIIPQEAKEEINKKIILINEYSKYPVYLPITYIQLERLRSLWTENNSGNSEEFLKATWVILYIYNTLGGLGNNGSVPIGLIPDFIELFGSPLNTQERYCSPFKFEQEFFGSLGSFFDYELIPNQKYTFNPPYSLEFMNNAAEILIKKIDNLLIKFPDAKFSIACIIPIWDKESLMEIGEQVQNYQNNFPAYDTLINSKYFVKSYKIPKDKHKFYSWYDNKWINYASTHLLLLSNVKDSGDPIFIDLNKYHEKWLLLSQKEIIEPTEVWKYARLFDLEKN